MFGDVLRRCSGSARVLQFSIGMSAVDHVKAVGNISSRDMPFARIDAVVIGVFCQPLAEVGQVGIDGERIADNAVFDGHAPGVPTCPCRAADGVGAIGSSEGYAFCDEAIHVWC